jgi:hypothetical protein
MIAEEVSHDVLAALIGAFAIIGAAVTTGLFTILSIRMRNGRHASEDRDEELAARIAKLEQLEHQEQMD